MSWNRRFGTGSSGYRPLSSPRPRSTSIFSRSAGRCWGEPYTRQLDGKLRELRFHLERRAVRVTYWIATGRRIVLLTVFAKARMREEREIERARRALAWCEAEEHTAEGNGDAGA